MDRKHPPRKPPGFIGIFLLILFCIQPASIAQDDISTNSPPVLTAAKLTDTPPQIDGKLDDDTWNHAPIATGFVQLLPDEGKPATERSEIRVLYGNDALYVGFRAYDTDSSAIEGQLTRRDRESFSDWVQRSSLFGRRGVNTLIRWESLTSAATSEHSLTRQRRTYS